MTGSISVATTLSGHYPLPASLFSSCGKLPITLMEWDDKGATAKSRRQPPCDSIALVVRNGVKVHAIISWIEGDRFGLRFDAPLGDTGVQARFTRPAGRRADE